MPARSKKQQMAAGAALSAKKGDTPKSKLRGASKDMYASMTKKELEDLASTKRKSLPTKRESVPARNVYPHTKDVLREKKKREKPGGKKAGRIAGKGGAGTSNKARGGKNAR